MAGYIELEVTKRDREAYEALHALLRIIVSLVDNADFVATVPDQEPVSFTAATLVVPDESQFDLVQEALRPLGTAHASSSELCATNDPPLVRLVCYRNGHPNERSLEPDELSVEYFNPRSDNGSFIIDRVESAVRLTHRSMGTVVVSDGARTRHRNLAQARAMLSAKLADDPTPLILNGQSIRSLQPRSDSTPTC